jgi:hypothetical protein
MIYVIMCGCNPYEAHPKHLNVVKGETLVERTIRLLKENGVEEIYISSANDLFDGFGVPRIEHDNNMYNGNGFWVDGFFDTGIPTTYLFGDVYFSPEAIKTIVETPTEDVEFFASSPPFARNYPKCWAEPFAFKVVNQEHFREAIEITKFLASRNNFIRHPIAWELWQIIKQTPINYIDYKNYTAINDYTCDVDYDDQLSQWR